MTDNEPEPRLDWLQALFWPLGDREQLLHDALFFMQHLNQPFSEVMRMTSRWRKELRQARIDQEEKRGLDSVQQAADVAADSVGDQAWQRSPPSG